MKRFKEYLTENPDNSTNAKGESLRWSDTNTVCFSVKDNVMFWINNDTHHKLAMNIMELTGEVYTIPHDVDLETYSYILISEEGHGRHKFDISGRLWKDDNTVSFWETKKEVLKYKDLLLQFFKEVGVNPKDLKYEYIDSVPTGEQERVRNIVHTKSPINKTDDDKKTKMPPKSLPAGHIPGQKWWAPKSESVSFKEHLTEGTITVPDSVLTELRQYMMDTYKEVKEKDLANIKNRKQLFNLDFSGTKYEYLNPISKEYPLLLTLFYAPGYTSEHYWGDKKNGVMKLNLSDFREVYTNTLEHEIVHHIQNLMNKSLGKHSWSDRYAGGMKKKLRDKTKDLHFSGYKKSALEGIRSGYIRRGSKRTHHSLRPVEHQSNMVSMVQELIELKHKQPEIANNEIFKKYINDSQRLQKLKKVRPEQYREYLKRLYAAFNEDISATLQSHKSIDQFLQDIEQDKAKRKEAERASESTIFWTVDGKPVYPSQLKTGTSEFVDSWDYYEFIDQDSRTDEDSMTTKEIAEGLFDIAGIKEQYSNNHDIYYVRIPASLSRMRTIFKNLKKYAEKYPKEERQVKYFSKRLADNMSNTIQSRTGNKIKSNDIFERFYLGEPIGPKPINGAEDKTILRKL